MKALSEMLLEMENLETEKERVTFLQNLPRSYLRTAQTIFKYMFDPAIKFRLPEGAPSYEPSKYDNPGILVSESARFYIFVEGGHPTVTDRRLQELFVNVLSTVIPTDAELLIAMKEKKSPYKGLTKSVVKKAFPELL